MCPHGKTLLLLSTAVLLAGVTALGFAYPDLLGYSIPGAQVPEPMAPGLSPEKPIVAHRQIRSGCGSGGGCCCAAKGEKCCCSTDSPTATEVTQAVSTVQAVGMLVSPQGNGPLTAGPAFLAAAAGQSRKR